MTKVDVEYRDLLAKYAPTMPKNDAEFERLVNVLESLDTKEKISAAESRLVETLAALVTQYENRTFTTRQVTPLEILVGLMEEQ